MESAIERFRKFLTLLFAEVSYLRSQTKFRYLFHILRPNEPVEKPDCGETYSSNLTLQHTFLVRYLFPDLSAMFDLIKSRSPVFHCFSLPCPSVSVNLQHIV